MPHLWKRLVTYLSHLFVIEKLTFQNSNKVILTCETSFHTKSGMIYTFKIDNFSPSLIFVEIRCSSNLFTGLTSCYSHMIAQNRFTIGRHLSQNSDFLSFQEIFERTQSLFCIRI